jgi:hypothetical protein
MRMVRESPGKAISLMADGPPANTVCVIVPDRNAGSMCPVSTCEAHAGRGCFGSSATALNVNMWALLGSAVGGAEREARSTASARGVAAPTAPASHRKLRRFSVVIGPQQWPSWNAAVGWSVVRRFLVAEVALDEMLSGAGQLLLVTGEPGIGKSALLTEVARRGAHRGSRVLRGACWRGDDAPPYWPWTQVSRGTELDNACYGEASRLLTGRRLEAWDRPPVCLVGRRGLKQLAPPRYQALA